LGSIPAMRGRVMALYSILFLGSTPIGGPLSGWLAEQFGTRWSMMMGAVAAATSGIVCLAALRRRDPAPVDSADSRLPMVAASS
jgi:MFS family permease